MTLTEDIEAVEARTQFRFPRRTQKVSRDLSRDLARLSGRIIGNRPTGRPAGGSSRLDHEPVVVERTVAWIRLNRVCGVNPAVHSELRREAQDAVPAEHRPGWVCISGDRAWFQPHSPIYLVLTGAGVTALRVHDDCDCLEEAPCPKSA